MQGIPDLMPDIRNFAKVILAAKDDPMYGVNIGWFMAGAWYMDAISMLILTLPDDDPTLIQILESMRSGTFYQNEIIAKNMLRFGMAMEESVSFISANVKVESLLLYARALVQGATKQPHSEPPAVDFAELQRFLAKYARPIRNSETISSFLTRRSLSDKWQAALSDPLWWLALGAIGILFFYG